MNLYTDLRSTRLHEDPARLVGRATTRRGLYSRRLLLNAARCALPWLCLTMVSLTAAHAMELGVESIGARVTESLPPGSISMVVLTFVNVDGSAQQLDCVMASPRVLSHTVLVNREDVYAVVRELCVSVNTGLVVSENVR